jgi:hypothetical protein
VEGRLDLGMITTATKQTRRLHPKITNLFQNKNHRIEVNHSTSPHCKRLYSTIKELMAHLKINQADTFPSTFYSMETASSVT